MSHSSWLTLIVPGGSAALAGASGIAAEPATQLAKIAGRGSLRRTYDRRDQLRSALRPWQRGLLAALGLSDGEHASAPLCAQESGEDEAGTFWMHLEPVHFVTGLDRLNLLPLRGAAGVTHEEGESLRAVIAAHLREWNLELCVLTDGTWNVRADQAMAITTTCPEAAATVELESALPHGKDAGALRRLMTELQMLLHDQRVNDRRLRAGIPAINALWPWGSGTSAAAVSAPMPAAYADAPYVRGLYRRDTRSIQAAPNDCARLLQSVSSTDRVIAVVAVADQAALEERWVAPLARALAAGQLSRLDVVLDDWHLDASRSALRKFWRKPLPPSQWAA